MGTELVEPKYKNGDEVLVRHKILAVYGYSAQEEPLYLTTISTEEDFEVEIFESAIESRVDMKEPELLGTVVVVANNSWTKINPHRIDNSSNILAWIDSGSTVYAWAELLKQGTPKVIWEPEVK